VVDPETVAVVAIPRILPGSGIPAAPGVHHRCTSGPRCHYLHVCAIGVITSQSLIQWAFQTIKAVGRPCEIFSAGASSPGFGLACSSRHPIQRSRTGVRNKRFAGYCGKLGAEIPKIPRTWNAFSQVGLPKPVVGLVW
jgi:hypothetical protein